MRLDELLSGVDVAELRAEPGTLVENIRSDSRSVGAGDMFCAVRGFTTDGHIYMDAALKAGASVIVCEEPPREGAYVLVSDSRKALADISANYYGHPADSMKMIGVTGTNGKTTTTLLIKHIIEKCTGQKCGLVGTIQNMIGNETLPTERTTPESLELQALLRKMADAGCSYAVMEVSSHALLLDRVRGIRFEVGAFLNLTPDHLDFHGTMDEYMRAKAVIFSICRKGVVNLDDEAAEYFISNAKCPIFTFSAENNEAGLVAKDIKLSGDRVNFCALTGEELHRTEVGIPGMFSVYNALAAFAAALQLGINGRDIAEAMKTAGGVKGRMEVFPTHRGFNVIIDYAHTPDALENLLRTVRGFTKGRVITLFGCGGDRDRSKRPVMGGIAARLSDYVIVSSDNPRTEDPMSIISDILGGIEDAGAPYEVVENRPAAIGKALDMAREGDTVVLAGKGHETYQILGRIKTHLDEREVLEEHLAQMKPEVGPHGSREA